MRVYSEEDMSTLVNGIIDNNPNGYSIYDTDIFNRTVLANNLNNIFNAIINGNYLLDNQKVLTETDLQSQIFMLIKNAINLNGYHNFKIHTELADRIPIHSIYCGNLIQQGDIGANQDYTRFTDITINYDGQYGDQNRLHKGFSLNGKHIDIEIKHIRNRDNAVSILPRIRRDLCKIKSLLHPDIINNANMNIHPNNYENENERDTKIDNEGCVVFGIMIISFCSLDKLENYLDNGLRDVLNSFNGLNNVATLIIYEE